MVSAGPSTPEHEGDPWIITRRLVLRRPRPDDLADYVRLHTDPRTYAHKPGAMPTPERCAERLAGDLAQWETEGVAYAAVLLRATGAVVGWAGLRVERDAGSGAHLNLYFRLVHDLIGAGYGREVARALVAWGVEHRPDLPLTAIAAPVNAASLATLRSAGLVEVDRVRHVLHPDDEPDVLHEAPTVTVLRDGDDVPVEEVLDLWVRVNDAGGAVGFVAGAPRAEVRTALDAHLAGLASGTSLLVLLRDPDGTVRGLGFWEHSGRLPFEHVARLKRLMVDPDLRGRNLGRLLLAGLVGAARRDLPGVGLLRLDYRSGLGLGDFYASCGWVEVGRIPGGLWLGGDDYRDDVAMARRTDGRPLVGDGRT